MRVELAFRRCAQVAVSAGAASVLALGVLTWPVAAQTDATAPLKVVVTIKPVHALAQQVLDGVAEPQLVVDGAASPHTYALKPSDAKLFNDADIVIRVSEGLEPFTAKIVKSLPKSVQVVTLERAKGVKTLSKRTGANFEQHSHAHEKGKAGHKGGHSHGHGHGHDHGKAKSKVDGHLWLDPMNAKAFVAEIARVASAKRPAAAGRIAENAAKATARLDALDKGLKEKLASVKGKPFVVFHDALQYFEARYGVSAVGSITVDPEVPPSGKRLADLRKRLMSMRASCVFTEPGYGDRVVQSVIEGTSAKVSRIDPEALAINKGPDAYDQLLNGLADSLKGCLASVS